MPVTDTHEEKLRWKREWYARNAEIQRARNAERYRRNADAIKAKSAARYAANREFIAARSKARYELNKEKAKAYNAAYHAAHPEIGRIKAHNRRSRIRKNGGRLSRDLVTTLMCLQRGKCGCCKADLSKTRFQLDHILPLALAGRNEDSNIQLLCSSCNRSKHAKHPIDFMQELGYLL